MSYFVFWHSYRCGWLVRAVRGRDHALEIWLAESLYASEYGDPQPRIVVLQ